MRLVVDTDVIVAAIRSPTGASAALLRCLLERSATMLLSVPLGFEYEATCLRAEHVLAARATEADITNLIDAIIDVIEAVEVHYQWRPQLSDAGDELVLEAAVNGRADAIVTFNRRDYGDAPARFGIEVLAPADALRRIRR
jgi:putative PIN family toxin of toxin-antitoxin system